MSEKTLQSETETTVDITDVRSFIWALGGPTSVSQFTGKPVATIKSWPHRDNIPLDHWQDLIDMAASLGMEGVDAAFLLALMQRLRNKNKNTNTGAHPRESMDRKP